MYFILGFFPSGANFWALLYTLYIVCKLLKLLYIYTLLVWPGSVQLVTAKKVLGKKVLKFPTKQSCRKKSQESKTQDFISSDIFSKDLRKFGLFSKVFISRYFFPETFFPGTFLNRFVRLYQINAKTAERIESKMFKATYRDGL